MSAAPEWNSESYDPAARERLIESYLPLVRKIARGFAYAREPYEDLVQVGSIGLIKAIDRFEATRGVSLAAFAVPNILGEIRRYLRDLCAPVRVPRHEQEMCVRIGTARRELTDRLQRLPSTSELAAAADLSDREIAAALRAERVRRPVPLAEAAGVASADEALDESEDRLFVASGLASLERRERQALRFRYFDDLSQDEIARRLGVSQSQTSRVIASGLAKLRAELQGELRCAGPAKPLHSGHGDSRCRRRSATGGRRPEAAAASSNV
jgi:RNA polymerase sigma-B factor